MPDFLNLIFRVDRGEAENNLAAFREIVEHEVVGKNEGLRTIGVRQEQVQFFACYFFTEQVV